MDEYAKTHYDSHASKTPSRKDRALGPAAPLKSFHNTIKRKLLMRFAQGASTLLDIACGRGGDLAKWDAAGLRHVVGVDISRAEIEEAQRRYHEGSFRPRCDFRVSSTLTKEPWTFGTFDVVTCMFAMHYFCASETMLRHMFENVSKSLRPGGYFIGTVADGARIQHYLRQGSTGPMLRLQALWSGPPRPFGCAYLCDIADTVTSGGSIEYLVDETTFTTLAKAYGLHPVIEYEDSSFDPTDRAHVFKHFLPPFSDPSLAQASSLFAAFVFQKK